MNSSAVSTPNPDETIQSDPTVVAMTCAARVRRIARLESIALLLGSFVPLLVPATAAMAAPDPAPREVEIVVDGGYKPAQITVKAGERVRLKFVRKEYTACTRELVIPALALRKELPPNKPVFVDLPALAPGEYEFRCGMNMVRGAITVVAG